MVSLPRSVGKATAGIRAVAAKWWRHHELVGTGYIERKVYHNTASSPCRVKAQTNVQKLILLPYVLRTYGIFSFPRKEVSPHGGQSNERNTHKTMASDRPQAPMPAAVSLCCLKHHRLAGLSDRRWYFYALFSENSALWAMI